MSKEGVFAHGKTLKRQQQHIETLIAKQ